MAGCDNYVRICADRAYMHLETLSGLIARLDTAAFVRMHRSHAANVAFAPELQPEGHGEYMVTLADRAKVSSRRSYRTQM